MVCSESLCVILLHAPVHYFFWKIKVCFGGKWLYVVLKKEWKDVKWLLGHIAVYPCWKLDCPLKNKQTPKSSSWRGNNTGKLHCVQYALQWKSLVEGHHAEDEEQLNVPPQSYKKWSFFKNGELDYITFIQITIQWCSFFSIWHPPDDLGQEFSEFPTTVASCLFSAAVTPNISRQNSSKLPHHAWKAWG